MRTVILVLLGLCILAAAGFATVKVFEHHQADGQSAWEKMEDELGQEPAEGKDAFPRRP